MKSDLQKKLESEIQRNQRLIAVYATIPTGAFAQMAIEQDIERAGFAIMAQDAALMVAMIRTLEGNE